MTATTVGAAGNRPRAVAALTRPTAAYHLALGSGGLLILLGLIMVLSASSVASYAASGSAYSVFQKQALWFALGLPGLAAGLLMPTRVTRRLGYPLLVLSVVLLVAVLVPGIGRNVYGARRWIGIGASLQIQPSELAKVALVVGGADLLARKQRRLHEMRHLLIPLVPIALLLATLVIAEPDMGTATQIVVILLALLAVAGAPARVFGFTFCGIAAAFGALAVVEPYRLARLTSFADPFKASAAGGYQTVQGLYAISSGGWWGLGLGASRSKWGYLPNQYTDYIFAVIGEELGLLGGLVVITLFAVFGYAGFRIAQQAKDPFSRLVAAGITAWIVGQALVNMCAVVGLLPVTGVPLPFVSFGGSSLVFTMFALGLLGAVGREASPKRRRRRVTH
ncbi:MAG TPA: putative lipid II flippase FtsW [Mycobacteriales bacterium]|jgi:cell division protein FtsW|nr:putative lipid II flippase FtsW [Mycobacteriales bacterium]